MTTNGRSKGIIQFFERLSLLSAGALIGIMVSGEIFLIFFLVLLLLGELGKYWSKKIK
ncbi:MAG: hypothetical protein LBV67_09595 [Streptococcaceae bacterium]|jgi:hypothetical protein|nr:hypothetical protein [Streptococcaceae bacterium]